MVVRLDLHQHVLQHVLALVGHAVAGIPIGHKAFACAAFHDGSVVAVSHNGVLRRHLLGVADHAEQGLVLLLAIDGELGIENLVTAMFAVGLREHHQLDVGRVALERVEGVDQVVDLVIRQGQAPVLVGCFQRGAATLQHVDLLHRGSRQVGEQVLGSVQRGQHALGHAVVQQRSHGLALCIAQAGAVHKVFGTALDTAYAGSFRQAAVAGNVGGLGGPGRHGADARRDDDGGVGSTLLLIRFAVGQQLLQRGATGGIQFGIAFHPVGKACADALHAGRHRLDLVQQLACAKRGQGVAALEGCDECLHGGGRRGHEAAGESEIG